MCDGYHELSVRFSVPGTVKAKGLLSQMLSLPEDWDYTLKGLSLINREKIDAIREAIKELERAGYIVRSRERDEKGRLRGADYVIFEQPQPPTPDLPTLENPTLDIEIPAQDDAFNSIRREYADMLKNQLEKGNNGLEKCKYITFSIEADNLAAAKARLSRILKMVAPPCLDVTGIPRTAPVSKNAMRKSGGQTSSASTRTP